LDLRPSPIPHPQALQLEGLRFAYPPLSPEAPAPWVLDGLDLRVGSGEWLAIMGASDTGKTTLCLLLAGLAPQLTGGTLEGCVVVAGQDTRQHPPPALADTVGLLFQEPEAQLFNPTVEAEVAWGLENLGLPAHEIAQRVSDMLALFHLDHARQRPPGDLSGGEKKRLALASVLALRPALLLLDEPMGGLDPAGRDEVLAALAALRRDRSTTIVMTESDPEAVAAFADQLVVLHQGRFVLEGPPRALFQQTEQMATLGVAVPQLARVAATLNRRLGTAFDFLTVEEAQQILSPPLGEGPGEGESVARGAIGAGPPPPTPALPPKGGGSCLPSLGGGGRPTVGEGGERLCPGNL
jgi:energy-coupling factor transporter ATP-binding protein EcfA2